jgi:hypothetical protein
MHTFWPENLKGRDTLEIILNEISCSHGGEYEDDSFLG